MKTSIEVYSMLCFLVSMCYVSPCIAQEEDPFAELDAMTEMETTDVLATFKSTRVMFAQSTERVKKGQLHFRVSHLFGNLSNGLSTLYGLDDVSNMHLSFDYGYSDKLQLSFARSNKPHKTLQFSFKWSICRQTVGRQKFPVSISYLGGIDIKTATYFPATRNSHFLGRLDYVHMLLISRKINRKFSVQISPSYLHRNLTETDVQPNDILALGIGAQYMLNRHVSVNGEYFHTLGHSDFSPSFRTNVLNLGLDVETGGHVFQLYLSNANALHPGRFLASENKDFFNGQIQLGFSIMREFNLIKS